MVKSAKRKRVVPPGCQPLPPHTPPTTPVPADAQVTGTGAAVNAAAAIPASSLPNRSLNLAQRPEAMLHSKNEDSLAKRMKIHAFSTHARYQTRAKRKERGPAEPSSQGPPAAARVPAHTPVASQTPSAMNSTVISATGAASGTTGATARFSTSHEPASRVMNSAPAAAADDAVIRETPRKFSSREEVAGRGKKNRATPTGRPRGRPRKNPPPGNDRSGPSSGLSGGHGQPIMEQDAGDRDTEDEGERDGEAEGGRAEKGGDGEEGRGARRGRGRPRIERKKKEEGREGSDSGQLIPDSSAIQIAEEKAQRIAMSAFTPDHTEERQQLLDSYSSDFATWHCIVKSGFSLLLYGYGSKRSLLLSFARETLRDTGAVVMEINGFVQPISMKQILLTLSEAMLQTKRNNAEGGRRGWSRKADAGSREDVEVRGSGTAAAPAPAPAPAPAADDDDELGLTNNAAQNGIPGSHIDQSKAAGAPSRIASCREDQADGESLTADDSPLSLPGSSAEKILHQIRQQLEASTSRAVEIASSSPSSSSCRDPLLYLLVHSIDGAGLAASHQQQHLLSEIASLPRVAVVASADSVNAGRLWSVPLFHHKFNFWAVHAPTYKPFSPAETAARSPSVPSLFSRSSSSSNAVSSASAVLASLTPNARLVFKELAQHQMNSAGGSSHGSGDKGNGSADTATPATGGAGSKGGGEGGDMAAPLTFRQLYSLCRSKFLVSNEMALRGHITEFKDHGLLRMVRAPNPKRVGGGASTEGGGLGTTAAEYLQLAIEQPEELQALLQQLRAMPT